MKLPVAVLAALVCVILPAACLGAEPPARSVPVVYCTDLFHPHEDPDDHFDLAVLSAMPEIDIRGLVLDQGRRQLESPGRIPVSQMGRITGRDVPSFLGLERPLSSPGDKGLDQEPRYQEGVRCILETLEKSPVPVAIITVGSVRDLVAAYNRAPDLLDRKVSAALVFIGEAKDPAFREYNVGLDPHAWVGLLRSRIPVWWVPCFDGGPWRNDGHASLWQARHADLLRSASPELVRYFAYALEKETGDPMEYLGRELDPAKKERLLAGTRNLWCTAIFGVVSGRQVNRIGEGDGARYVSIPAADPKPVAAPPRPNDLFGFGEVEVSVGDDGVVKYGPGPGSRKVLRFEVRDRERYAAGMTQLTAGLLESLGRP
jgi:hypothetical protein